MGPLLTNLGMRMLIGLGGNVKLMKQLILEGSNDRTLQMVPSLWEDLRVPANTIRLLGLGADPSWVQFRDDGVASNGVYALSFSGAGISDEEITFTCQIPHSYKEGSAIYPHVHWAPSNSNIGNVRWSLEYSWANIDEVFGFTSEIHVVDSTESTDRLHNKAVFDPIDGTGKRISSMLACRLHRDAGHLDDSYGSSAFLLEIDFHFEVDTFGSRRETVK